MRDRIKGTETEENVKIVLQQLETVIEHSKVHRAPYPDTQVEVVNTAAGRAVNEINVMRYEMMVRYICLLPEKEKYLKEMKRASW